MIYQQGFDAGNNEAESQNKKGQQDTAQSKSSQYISGKMDIEIDPADTNEKNQ